MRKVKVLQYNAVFQKEEEDGYSVWIPALPGCCSQGETFEEALQNIKEAIQLYLETEPEMISYGDESKERQFLIPVTVSYA